MYHIQYIECRVPWVRISRAALLFSLEKRALLGVVDLFVVPLPFYLVVFTCVDF